MKKRNGEFMRVDRLIAIAACGALALIAWSQSPKAGLYEVTNRMTWQKSPFPDGMQAPAGSGGLHTGQACITQAQIDKYNGPKPEANGGCEVTHIQKLKNGMTAEISCSGSMKGKGSVKTKWTDSGHSNSKVHFTGEMQMGQNARAVEWTIESESAYKGPDCGSIKPSTTD
jgi:hypothetical protein